MMSLGLCIQLYLYGFDTLHVVFMAAVAYAMMAFLPRHKSASVVMVWVLLYLSYNHLMSILYNFGGYQMDISTYTMLEVCKLSALAYCYQDGCTDSAKLTQDQRDRMVTKLPSILEFWSYIWYCQACALGVFFEFADYKRFVERSHEYKDIPSPILPSLKWMAQGLIFLALFIVVGGYMPVDFCWNEKYWDMIFLLRIAYYTAAMTAKRWFYYVPFSMTTGGIIASGLGYNGRNKQGEDQWNKIVGVYAWECETSSSAVEMLRYWNHQVHLWLKFYVLQRLTPVGKQPGMFESMSTFILSAFWHGFYPSYYALFFFAALLSEVSKDIYKAGTLFSFIPALLRPILANQLSMLSLNYCGILICALTWENSKKFMGATYGLVPIGLTVSLLLSRNLGMVKYAKKLDAKKTGKEN